jgi:hypothetical protein
MLGISYIDAVIRKPKILDTESLFVADTPRHHHDARFQSFVQYATSIAMSNSYLVQIRF